MPAAPNAEVTPVSASERLGDHPKDLLYERAYDPLTRIWFECLASSEARIALLAEIPDHDLVTNLLRFNSLFHDLVDESMNVVHDRQDILSVVSRYRDHVLWEGHMAPGAAADLAGIKVSLSEKMKRNVSLGVIEALICLESALVFARDELGLCGDELVDTLRRSRQLYGSLAVLHDEQEMVRLNFLAGIDGYLTYPGVDYQHILDGTIRISADKFIVADPDHEPRLRFVATTVQQVTLSSPTRRCPAHRLRSSQNPDMTLNDVLWDLLIDIYRQAGCFA
jgi:hypothetical protein